MVTLSDGTWEVGVMLAAAHADADGILILLTQRVYHEIGLIPHGRREL